MAAALAVGLACDSTTGVDVPFTFDLLSQQEQEAEGHAGNPQATSSVSGATVVVRGTAFTPCAGIPVVGDLDMKGPREIVVKVVWTDRSACNIPGPDDAGIVPYEARVGPLDPGSYTLEVRQTVSQGGNTFEEETVHTAEFTIPGAITVP